MEYLDRLAEDSIKQALKDLGARSERANSKSVPPEARKILLAKGRNRLSQADAEKRVQRAIERMKERKEIKAPTAPYTDWALIGQAPASPTDDTPAA